MNLIAIALVEGGWRVGTDWILGEAWAWAPTAPLEAAPAVRRSLQIQVRWLTRHSVADHCRRIYVPGMLRRRRLFLQEYIGLCNRLESLFLAFAIQRAFGHEVCLDWSELDVLSIGGTSRRSPGPIGRVGALRLRECSMQDFGAIGAYRKILLRTYLGPDELLDPLVGSTLARIRVGQSIVQSIQQMFGRFGERPVAGVHIRRGDYPMVDPETYDAKSAVHSAVPLWWYERTMSAMARNQPDIVFYLSCSGARSEFEALRRNFDVVEGALSNPYSRRESGHASELHPVADLFALACCPVLLATPMSSFSHYAAHLLGEASLCVVPPLRVSRSDWGACSVNLAGRRLPAWSLECKSGERHVRLSDGMAEIEALPASLRWLSRFC